MKKRVEGVDKCKDCKVNLSGLCLKHLDAESRRDMVLTAMHVLRCPRSPWNWTVRLPDVLLN